MMSSSFAHGSVFEKHKNLGLHSVYAQIWWSLAKLDGRRWHEFSQVPIVDLAVMFKKMEQAALGGRVDPLARKLGLIAGTEPDLARILQASSWIKKLRIPRADLAPAAIDNFLSIERAIGDGKGLKSLCLALRSIMNEWLQGINLEDLPYSHGPGTTKEKCRSLWDKYKALAYDWRLAKVIPKEHLLGLPDVSMYEGDEHLDIRTARLTSVPKDLTKERTIGCEPASLMFFQKGVQIRLYDWLLGHPYLKRHIPLTSQDVNQRLAQRGAAAAWKIAHGLLERDQLATIDLSNASDWLTWYVVRQVFYRTPLWRLLWATRSTHMHIDSAGVDAVIPLKKFAPMGSALNFPIQSLVYASVVEYVRRSETTPLLQRAAWSVFGDDIICHVESAPTVLQHLERLGLKVNHDKTFMGAMPFRESCGSFYFDEDDITPFFLKETDIRTQPEVAYALELACKLKEKRPEEARVLRTCAIDRLPNKVKRLAKIPGAVYEHDLKTYDHAGIKVNMHPEYGDTHYFHRASVYKALQEALQTAAPFNQLAPLCADDETCFKGPYSKPYQRRMIPVLAFRSISDMELCIPDELRYYHALVELNIRQNTKHDPASYGWARDVLVQSPVLRWVTSFR